MGFLKKTLGLLGSRDKPEAESTKSLARPSTLYVPSPDTETSSSQSLKPSRPTFSRASSAPVASRTWLASAEHCTLPPLDVSSPLLNPGPVPAALLARPVEHPIILRCTTGPTILGPSNLAKKVPDYIRPKTARKSVDVRPPFGHNLASFTTSVSMPALSELVLSPSTTSITIIPPSPPTAEVDDAPMPTAHIANAIQSTVLDLPAQTPALEQQEFAFASNVASLPSPTSEYGGDLYTPSPSLGSFTLPDYPTRRPVASSCIPEETSSDGSPGSIRSRMDPESPVVLTALTMKPSRATLVQFNPRRPITLDLSSATRKPNRSRPATAGPSRIPATPNHSQTAPADSPGFPTSPRHFRQVSCSRTPVLPDHRRQASSSGTPMSPNYARPLALERPSSPSTPKARSRDQQLDVEVEEMSDQSTPPSTRNPFQGVLEFMSKIAREEGVSSGVDESAVGAAH